MPKLLAVDYQNERLLKEYIEGPTIEELVKTRQMKDNYFDQKMALSALCKKHNINIDYYSTNIIVSNDFLYYIDYEYNDYDEKWDYDHWGLQFWLSEVQKSNYSS